MTDANIIYIRVLLLWIFARADPRVAPSQAELRQAQVRLVGHRQFP